LCTSALTGLVVLACSAPAPAAAPAASSSSPTAGTTATNPTSAAAGSPTTVHIGLGGAASDGAVYIALDKGYFAEQGINPDISRIDSLIAAFPVLASGALDVAGGTVNVALFNAAAQAVPVKMVADKGSCPQGFGYTGLVVRPELADKVKSAADVKGLRYVAPTANLPDTAAYLKTAGLSEADFSSATVLDILSIGAALANKNTDVAYAAEPFLTQWVSQGIATPVVRCDVMFPNEQLGVLTYSTRFVTNTDLATRFMVAYLKGVRDYNDAFAKKTPAAHDFAISTLTKYTSLKDPSLANTVVQAGLNPNGDVNTDSIGAYQDFYLQLGTQTQRVDLSQLIDLSFARAAAAKLGPYQ
jgi:NitT/TauT family transport system substrate-binding protein